MLIAENGTGVPEANAYVDISFAGNYLMGGRLARFTELSEDEKKSAIIAGSQLVDISYEWLGNRKTLEQGLAWPRTGVELDGFTVDGVPAAVKKAACEAAWLSMTEDSLFSTENNKEVIREHIEGAVDVSYANPKDRANVSITRFEILDKLLRGLYGKEETAACGSSVGSAQVERV